MDENKKFAYRQLIYWSLCESRSIQWSFSGLNCLFRPLGIINNIKEKGAILNWLHNLAIFSSLEFKGFDETQFWNDGIIMSNKHPEAFERYKSFFQKQLVEYHEIEKGQQGDQNGPAD